MLDLLLPIVCAGCDRIGDRRLCSRCRSIRWMVPPASFEFIDEARAMASTDSALGDAIRAAKYAGDRALMFELAGVLADGVRAWQPPDHLVPVPTTGGRLMRRGFSPSRILAEAVGRRLGVGVRQPLRMRGGRAQASLGRRERRAAFVGRVSSTQTIHGEVWLIDDVVTTGATADAMGMELLCAGAERVRLVTLCATPRRTALFQDIEGHTNRGSLPYN